MNSGDRQRLMHIRRYCQDIAGFVERFGNNYDTFTQDRAYTNAVSLCVLQIGELANSLSAEFREETKDQMPWGMIRGMRNWIAHAYAEMDENVIWETATNDIPGLLRFCDKVLQQSHEKAQQEALEKPSVLKQLGETLPPSERKPPARHKNDFER